uniref:Uncharacterized protein n=1 Tax=Cucumis melo TaxID=3656 RepID=A0A9I9E7D6_CUCME
MFMLVSWLWLKSIVHSSAFHTLSLSSMLKKSTSKNQEIMLCIMKMVLSYASFSSLIYIHQ